MRRARRGRKRKAGKHLSLSATDADWEIVRRNADRRGLSIARYLVELVERDAAEEDAGLRREWPDLALAREEQRELLEAVREVRALLVEGEDAVPLVRDMQERIAVMFAAWASEMAGSDRSEELRAALASVLGEERASIAAASVVPTSVVPTAVVPASVVPASAAVSTAVSTEPPTAKQEVAPLAREGKTDPRQNRLL